MVEFRNISEFPRGTLYNQLVDAYSFNDYCRKTWDTTWKEYDDFFYDNLDIANKYCFITVLDGEPLGHIQLEEAIRRIKKYDNKKIIVTTNEIFVSAQKNYESVGFIKINERENKETPFAGKYIDYEIKLK